MTSNDIRIPAHIFSALVESTKAMEQYNVNNETKNKAKTQEKTVNKNIIKKPKINAILTADEKKRYALIGAEFFKPLFKKIEYWKNKESMLIKNDDNDIVKNNLKKQYSIKDFLKNMNTEKWTAIIMLAIVGIMWVSDIIYKFFSTLSDKFENKIQSAIDWIKNAFDFKSWDEKIKNFFNGEEFKKLNEILDEIQTTVTKNFNDVWAGIKKKMNFDVISDAIKSIPKALADVLDNIAKWLRGTFEGAEDEDEEDEEDTDTKNSKSINPSDSIEIQKLEAERQKRILLDQFNSTTAFMRSSGHKKVQEELLTKAKAELNELGISSQDEMKNIHRVLEIYRNKANQALGAGQLSQEANKKIISFTKDLNFNNPPSIEEIRDSIKQIFLVDKVNRNPAGTVHSLSQNEQKKVDDLTIEIVRLGDKFSKIPELGGQIILGEELQKNPEKAFAILQENARVEGRLSEFQFVEARSAIIDSTTKIVNSFNEFSTKIADSIAEDLKSYFSKLKPEVILKPTIKAGDNKSTTNYSVITLDKSELLALNNKVVDLAAQTVDEIKKQNETLTNLITVIKEKPQTLPTSIMPLVSANNTVPSNNSGQRVALGAQSVRNNSINSVS